MGPGAQVIDSVLLDGVAVGARARIERAVFDEGAQVAGGVVVGGPAASGDADDEDGITLVGPGAEVDRDLSTGARHPER